MPLNCTAQEKGCFIMKQIKIAPSILSADFSRVGEEIKDKEIKKLIIVPNRLINIIL